jgi:hypothetical protein
MVRQSGFRVIDSISGIVGHAVAVERLVYDASVARGVEEDSIEARMAPS